MSKKRRFKDNNKIVDKFDKIKENKYFQWLLKIIYIGIILIAFVNVINLQIPYLNLIYSRVNKKTDYTFLLTYPPSVTGLRVGNANETIIFQAHIYANKMITENTPVIIEAEACEGISYVQNVSTISLGFFGANYIKSEQVIFKPQGSSNEYELWSGFAGEILYPNVKPETMILLEPEGGVTLGGTSKTVYFTEAGNKPVTIIIDWKKSVFPFTYTYDYVNIHVYAYKELRDEQIAYTGIIIAFGGLLFGIFEVIPCISRKDD